MIHAFEKACGKALFYKICPRRPGDIGYACPDSRERIALESKIRIEEMCASQWKWQSMNPNGYEK
ncbi:MAG: hypothetical protein ACLRSW_04635 [Christensenellaceae bacterium]